MVTSEGQAVSPRNLAVNGMDALVGYPFLDEDGPAEIVTEIGTRCSGGSMTIRREDVLSYAAATAFPCESAETLGEAPPVFSAVASIAAHGGLLARTVPRHELTNVVHLSQTMYFTAPLLIGQTVTSSACLVEYKSGRFGCTLTYRVEVEADGRRLSTAFEQILVRGPHEAKSGGTPVQIVAPPRGEGPAVGYREVSIEADQSIRYSEASGDHLPIHTDPKVAKAAGFPGLVLHGMCTLAVLAHTAIDIVADGNPSALTAVSARFARPVLCGRGLAITLTKAGENGVWLRAQQAGKAVVRDAWATWHL